MCVCCVCCTVSDFILYILALFFPPVAVLIRSGFWSSDFFLNVILTLLGFMPGLVHAFYYITITSPLRRSEEYYFYQQGWVDNERLGASSNVQNPSNNINTHYGSSDNRANIREDTNIREPLLLESRDNNVVGSGDYKQSTQNSPPPYSE
ncbi:Sna4p NDAI_0A02310 [Naumovozyma dairenensis CBS 421]|uniref:Stress response RCI peptide n=1 Tax=Naumovozyma dairenensis (strain ATCC 10597 / BCRC 20456 / CBS 421 / NBRC 0211 / NRRL Y-12639) TaxID=1071378 RepID=G0W3K1_NAUDC|nr:hypothetical protein NDAI_0A02310 [Naumovozyma dairenensis CBS 421]CCD22389.1 hypothetical protein NDAI_0A02310 [Naumovozyma dairenensis CBS 421]